MNRDLTPDVDHSLERDLGRNPDSDRGGLPTDRDLDRDINTDRPRRERDDDDDIRSLGGFGRP